jgi:diacylglycerol kinase family enzyme
MAVILNKQSGSARDRELIDHIDAAFVRNGITADIRLCDNGADIPEMARRSIDDGYTTIVAAGGDGTISAVAAEVVRGGTTLGVLPLGTLNHFARDIGMPLDIDEAVKAIATGKPTMIDVGEVNGRIFLNNSSLGLYPHFVRHRRKHRRLGKHRWSALVQALWTLIGRYPFLYTHVSTDGREVVTRTPMVFIGNNDYQLEGLNIGKRNSLTDGRLALYMTRQVGVGGFLFLALRALVGRLRDARDFIADHVTELSIEVRRGSIHVALDGEVMTLQPPLHYCCRPRALCVIVPGQRAMEED